MDNTWVFFTAQQGNLLVRLLLAHLLADFVFQTKFMLADKKWLSKGMGAHIATVGLATFLFSLDWQITLIVAFSHWIMDSLKIQWQQTKEKEQKALFFLDQAVHVGVILLVWVFRCGNGKEFFRAIAVPFTHYAASLLVLAYVWVIWPVGFLLKYALDGVARTSSRTLQSAKIEHGGRLIGQFERIIILTFVLLNQYAAIGFLMTGKSIIRFAQNDENLRSEYILMGTMMSYAISILTGVTVNWLLSLAG